MRAVFFPALAAGLLLTAGCSGPAPRGPVRGRVTVGANPVTAGTIIFENKAAGVAVTCPLNEDGTYEFKTHEGRGLPVGAYDVAITPGGVMTGADDVLVPGKPPPPPPRVSAVKIPSRYHTTATSRLHVEVKAGDNPPFDFDLSAKQAAR